MTQIRNTIYIENLEKMAMPISFQLMAKLKVQHGRNLARNTNWAQT
jgi:hypothetical protein